LRALRDHIWHEALCAVHNTPEVHLEGTAPVVLRPEYGGARMDAGVVHENMHSPEPLTDFPFEIHNLLDVTHIAPLGQDRIRAALRGFDQAFLCGIETVLADVGNAYLHAKSGETVCGSKTDSGGTAGYYGYVGG